MVEMPACHAGDDGFEPHTHRHGPVDESGQNIYADEAEVVQACP